MSFFRTHRHAFFILIAHFLFFSLLGSFLSPHPDMIDHWVWSLFPQWSYYEHPPMIAWFIRIITLLGGHSELSLELGAQFYNLSILFLSYLICSRLFNQRAALIYLLLLESTLYFSAGSLFLHIDQPFMIFWLLAIYGLCRFHQSQSIRWLLWIGVIAGLGALSKYIMILFYIGLFVHLLIYQDVRKHLKNPGIYLAGVISLLLFTPVLWWNYQNDWVSFRFQFQRGMMGDAPLGQNFILFTVGHLLMFSAVWSWWLFRDLWQRRLEFRQGSSVESVLLVTSLVPLAFFSIMSLRGDIADPHWANISYLGLMMLAAKRLALVIDGHNGWYRRALAGGFVFNLSLVLLVALHLYQPLIDLTRYQLKYSHSLVREGMSDELLDKLRPLKNHEPLSKDAFLKKVSGLLTLEELSVYAKPLINNTIVPERASSLLGWQETAESIQSILTQAGYPEPAYIISKEFQLSAALTFYLPSHPLPHSLEKPERNQWSPLDEMRQNTTIAVCTTANCSRVRKRLRKRFQMDMSYLGELTTEKNGRVIRQLEVYLVFNLDQST